MDIKSKNNNQINPNNQNTDTEIKIERKYDKKYNITNNGLLIIIIASLLLFSTAYLCFSSVRENKHRYDSYNTNTNYIDNNAQIKDELIRYAKNLDRFYIYFAEFNPELAKARIEELQDILKDMKSKQMDIVFSRNKNGTTYSEISRTNIQNKNINYDNEAVEESFEYSDEEITEINDNLEENNEFVLDNNESPESLYQKDFNNMTYNQLDATLVYLRETLQNYKDVKNYLDKNKWFKYYIEDKEKGEVYTNCINSEADKFLNKININNVIFQNIEFNGLFISDAFLENGLECSIMIPMDIPKDSEISSLIIKTNRFTALYGDLRMAGPILLLISLILFVFVFITNKKTLKLYTDKLYNLYLKLPLTVSIIVALICILILILSSSDPNLFLINALYYSNIVHIVFLILLQSLVFLYLYLFLKNIINIIRNPKILKESLEIKLLFKIFDDIKIIMKSQNIILLFFYLLVLLSILITLGTLCFVILISISYNVIECILLSIGVLFILLLEMIPLNLISAYCKLSYYISEISKGTIENIPKQKGLFSKPINNLNNINSGVKVTINKMIKNERLKTELITNVSHDLKTPLTSIISYIDLLKELHLNDSNACEYINIIDSKSQRLKILIEDLFEASKLSAGQYELEIKNADIVELFKQTLGELSYKIENSNIDFKYTSSSEHIYLYIDGNKMWRVFENLLNNIIKYSQPLSRAYVTISETDLNVIITMKNISAYEMDFDPEELFERFKRGDSSRTTEGSGLGLSISKSIVELHGGTMDIIIDGDLFKTIITLNK